jgi:hypothetical protein
MRPRNSRFWSWRDAALGAALGTVGAFLFSVQLMRGVNLQSAGGILLITAWFFVPCGAIAANVLSRVVARFPWARRIMWAVAVGAALAISGTLGSGPSFALLELRFPTLDDLRVSRDITQTFFPLLLAHCVAWSLGFTLFRSVRQK